MIFRSFASLVLAAVLMAATFSVAQAQGVDPKLPSYERVSGVSGSLSSVGSDTLNNMMTLWAEGFRKIYPNVNIQIEGKGSSTAPPAMIEGVSQLGPMSRPMKSSEAENFEKKFGYKPTSIGVALDAVAVYVNKDNPVQSLTLQQVDAIFSKNRKGGHPTDITTWGQAGASGSWSGTPISIYGRNSASGTYGFFKETALFKGDYKDTVKEQPGSSAVVQGVTADKGGVGYSGIGYRTSGVRPVPLSTGPGKPAFETTAKNVVDGNYPLGRLLLVYINQKPNAKGDKLVSEFMKFVLSKEGQEIVVKDGYMPLDADSAAQMRSLIQ